LFEYFDTLADPLAASDLVLARAGGSVFELAVAGRPAVLVPYPHATGDHQARNANWMADAGAARLIFDDELNAKRLRGVVESLLLDDEKLSAMSAASSGLAQPDATARIASEVLDAAGGGR
jgi:UDP-N-acetylglucosamine--N-acetylmuramyl-(pentapeptide) pyrophosphoryl-undecaprenol N-acetylglucosamine transferase